ncbi:hypothetical protein Tco_1415493 [Tanacetum coccineum]
MSVTEFLMLECFAEIIVLSSDSSNDDRKRPSKASVPIFEGPSVQGLLDYYGYNDIEEYLSWNHFPSTDKENIDTDITDKDTSDEDCIHECNYAISKELENLKCVQKRQRGKESCHREADHVLVKDQSIMGSLICLLLHLHASICSLHMPLAFAASICKQAFAACICSLHLQQAFAACICSLHLWQAFASKHLQASICKQAFASKHLQQAFTACHFNLS